MTSSRSSREAMLARIRTAIGTSQPPAVRHEYATAGTLSPAARLDLLVERIEDYRATVVRVGENSLASALDAALGHAASVVLPAGLPPELVEAIGARAVPDEPQRSAPELDAVDAVVTTAAVAIAVTGTIVLDAGPGQGRRALSLVPDLHVVVLRVDQVVETVPEALEKLDGTRPLTFISGPSATSDIELNRVEGVHGPRTLKVLLLP